MKPLTARQIMKKAYPNGKTWSDDRTVKTGKLHINVAYEINHQPSNTFTPFALFVAVYDPETDTAKGRYITNKESVLECFAILRTTEFIEKGGEKA